MQHVKKILKIDINYHMAWLVKTKMCGDSVAQQGKQCQKLHQYAELIYEHDPLATVNISGGEGAATWVFICPSAMKNTWKHARCYTALDGTFCPTAFKYTLLLITGYDGNNQTIPFA